MWEATKEVIAIIKKAMEKHGDADEMKIIFELDKKDAIKLGEELSRLTNVKDILHKVEVCKDPDIWRVTCLYDTVDFMTSKNYKARFYAEYWQLKLRYEKLKNMNTRIEAANRAKEPAGYPPANISEVRVIQVPQHDCPESMLRAQQEIMGEYLHILEMRAVIEGIDLSSMGPGA